MIRALALILACQLGGEILSRALSLPAPGPVLGMVALWLLMTTVPAVTALVRPTAEGILRHLSLLFVPAGVGVVGHLDRLGPQSLPLAVAIVASTVLAIGAGAAAFTLVARLTGSTDD